MEQDLFVWLNWKRWFFSLSPNGIGLAEWLEYQIGIRYKHQISEDNPLFTIELSDCTVSVGKATLDNKEIEIDKIV